MSASCIYEGTIRHRRAEPPREFRHRLALAYIDLDELPNLLGGRLVDPRPGALRFRRRDYLGEPHTPLATAVRETVLEQIGIRCEGPVRVLTQLRSFGHCFNPVSFYYCLDSPEGSVQAIVAEVTNTPWGERHSYVVGGEGNVVLHGELRKALHVSPFLGMDHSYLLRAAAPGETLAVNIESLQSGRPVFEATLSLRRHELTPGSAASLTARYPFATLRVLALIYGHGLALRLGGAPVYRRPEVGHG